MNAMPLNRALELLKLERECVQRQSDYGIPSESNKCRREWEGTCRDCDLVQSDVDILQMYDTVINLITNYVDYRSSVKEWAKCLPDPEPKDIKKVLSERNLNMSNSSTFDARGISCE
jgi:hypothetical protein